MVGWQPTDDTARKMFRVLEDLSIEGLASDAVGTDRQQVGRVLLETAKLVDHTKGRPNCKPIQRPRELIE
eukprot:3019929-Pyramimonas_sp.AAC.1